MDISADVLALEINNDFDFHTKIVNEKTVCVTYRRNIIYPEDTEYITEQINQLFKS